MNHEQTQFYNYLLDILHRFGDWLYKLREIKGDYLIYCVLGLFLITVITPIIFLIKDRGKE